MYLNSLMKIRVLRIVTACIGLFLVTWYFQVPEKEWSLITLWFVMFEYSYVGGALKKCMFRLVGTVLSGCYAIIVVYFFSNNIFINIIALTAGAVFYANYFLDTDKTYVAIIGCVTLTIGLCSSHSDLGALICRMMNVIIGILVAMFMFCFFFPRYASDEILKKHLNFIEQIMNFIQVYLDTSISDTKIEKDFFIFEAQMVKNLQATQLMLGEIAFESLQPKVYITFNQSALLQIKHLLRLIFVLIGFLSTPEIRENSAIREHLVFVHATLQNIKNLILKRRGDAWPAYPQTRISNPTLENIFIHLKQKLLLLDHDIQKILTYYHAKNQPNLIIRSKS